MRTIERLKCRDDAIEQQADGSLSLRSETALCKVATRE
jgi:hypothetical protein